MPLNIERTATHHIQVITVLLIYLLSYSSLQSQLEPIVKVIKFIIILVVILKLLNPTTRNKGQSKLCKTSQYPTLFIKPILSTRFAVYSV